MRGVRVLALVVMAGTAAACASAQASGTAPAGPPLAVPEAPPRAATAPIAAEPASEPDAAVADEPAAAVPEPMAAPEPAAPAPRPVASPAPAAAPPELPDRNLRTGGAAGGDAALASIRTQLRRAARDLALVDYNALSGAGRLQYEQSRRFSQQAEAALRDQNLAFAATLAEKAAALAGGLAGR